jgi:hypothetical protein
MGFDAPVPETDSQWAFSADTEGERRANLRYRNRTITAQVLLDKSTSVLLEALENTLGQKVGKLAREGGELRFTYPTGTTITFNVLEASMQRVFDIADMAKFRARYELSFICEPFGLGTEVDMGDNTETTLPVLIFTETGILGDVPALGRLIVDEDDADDQWWLTWGIQSRYYSSSANAALFYEAEGRTALSGSATAVGPTGASGGGSNVMRNTGLISSYQAVLSTQATGGGAHLSHIGTFRVYARIQTPTSNTGSVVVAMEWGEGDFSAFTRNSETTIPSEHEGKWRLVDLGLITLRTVTAGTQRWEGRIIVKSTVDGDDIDVDYLMLIPIDEGSGIVSGVARDITPTTFSARDDFTSTTSGNALNTRTPVTGAAWVTSGGATDFAFIDALAATYNTNEAVSRSVSGSTPRLAVLGSNMTDMRVQSVVGLESSPSVFGGTHGLIGRFVDGSNYLYLAFQIDPIFGFTSLQIWKNIAGVFGALSTSYFVAPSPAVFEIDLTIYATGSAVGRLRNQNGATIASVSASDSTLATGGTLASGKPGIFDAGNGTDTYERFWDDIRVSVPPRDAAVFASQSIEIRHDRIVREDSGGTLWVSPSSYEGDYLKVPPAGAEGRTVRVIVKSSRADPLTESDPAIDDLSARLFVQPRFLVVPDA